MAVLGPLLLSSCTTTDRPVASVRSALNKGPTKEVRVELGDAAFIMKLPSGFELLDQEKVSSYCSFVWRDRTIKFVYLDARKLRSSDRATLTALLRDRNSVASMKVRVAQTDGLGRSIVVGSAGQVVESGGLFARGYLKGTSDLLALEYVDTHDEGFRSSANSHGVVEELADLLSSARKL